MLKRLRRLLGLPGFLREFLNSPEGENFKAGRCSYKRALSDFNAREQAEHEETMELLRRKEWALSTKLELTERKVDKKLEEVEC